MMIVVVVVVMVVVVVAVVRIEPSVWHIWGECSTPELYPFPRDFKFLFRILENH